MSLPAEQKPEATPRIGSLRAIPRTVVALGIGSLFMDMSSEVIHSLLPAFLVSVLGLSALSVGIIEGIAEATSSITRTRWRRVETQECRYVSVLESSSHSASGMKPSISASTRSDRSTKPASAPRQSAPSCARFSCSQASARAASSAGGSQSNVRKYRLSK